MGFALLYVLFGCGVDGSGGIFDGRRGGGAGIWFGGNVARGKVEKNWYAVRV